MRISERSTTKLKKMIAVAAVQNPAVPAGHRADITGSFELAWAEPIPEPSKSGFPPSTAEYVRPRLNPRDRLVVVPSRHTEGALNRHVDVDDVDREGEGAAENVEGHHQHVPAVAVREHHEPILKLILPLEAEVGKLSATFLPGFQMIGPGPQTLRERAAEVASPEALVRRGRVTVLVNARVTAGDHDAINR